MHNLYMDFKIVSVAEAFGLKLYKLPKKKHLKLI